MKSGDIHFDKLMYQRTIAKAILFKAIDALYGKDGIALQGYKSNMVAYSMAVLSLNSKKELNLDAIWKEQIVISPSVFSELTLDIHTIYAKLLCGDEHISYKIKKTTFDSNGKRKNKYVLKELPQKDIDSIKTTVLYRVLQYIKNIEPFIYKHIVEIDAGFNVNEWTKKKQCWLDLVSKLANEGEKYKFPFDLLGSSDDKALLLSEGQRKCIEQVKLIGPDIWFSLNKWGKNNPGKLTPIDIAVTAQVGFCIRENKPLSFKLAKNAFDIYENAVDLGWKI